MSDDTCFIDETPDNWTPLQRALFVRLYRHMVSNQEAFKHPRAPMLDAGLWVTTCWNAAWMAATWCLDPDGHPAAVHVEGDNVIAMETKGTPQ